jgi:hypothetical protein
MLPNSTFTGAPPEQVSWPPPELDPETSATHVGYGVDKNDLRKKRFFAFLSGKNARPFAKKTLFCYI